MDDRKGSRRFSIRRTADKADSPIFADQSAARRDAQEASRARRDAIEKKDAERADDDGMSSPR